MKNRNFKKAISALLCMVMIFSSVAMGVSAFDFTTPGNMFLISKTESRIAPGVTENKIITNGKDGDSQVMGYAVEVDTSNKSTAFAVGYNNYDGTKWSMQTVRKQAAAIEKKRGVNVVAAFNADIYNMQTGEPTGCLVMNNTTYKAGIGRPYFAVMKDGSVKIGRSMTQEILNNCSEAVSGFFTLIENGVRTAEGNSDDGLVPKTAVGIKADGKVIVYCADGRNYPVSVGLSNKGVADIMEGLGCVDVLNLDGGGSTTYAAKYEGSSSLEVANNPSDGVERNVASSLFVISNAKPTGEFDHASMLPNNELYTPESTVQFSAKGVDSSGAAADLPSDGKFVLAEESAALGTITDDGLFTSNGTAGDVKVNYVSGGEVCGSTTIGIVVPDTLHVPNSEVSLGFEDTTDFGLIAKYQSRTVAMKDGDLLWAIADFDGNDLGETVGTFNGLTFTTLDGVTQNAIVTARLKYNLEIGVEVKAIIGAMPVVMYDFEYTTDKEEADNSNGELKYIPSYKMPRFDRSTGTSSQQQADEFYKQGYPLYCWPNASLDDQESMKATVVSKDDGEPVRFGNKSLRIDYDYSSYNGSSNSNNYLRVTSPTYSFEGSPTAIGCWVYVPEGTANFVLYLNCSNGKGSATYGVLTGDTGINWTGWKYVEFDLTNSKNAGAGSDNAPFGFYQSCGVFWISYQSGGPRGDKTASRIYLDNIQLIYGANVDDTVNPEILSMHSIGKQIEKDGSTVFDKATNTFTATFKDDDGKYATGIDPDEVKMYIDGVDETENCTIVETDGEIHLYDKTLSDGVHSIKVTVADKFGNTSEETRYFFVNANQGKTEVSLSAQGTPILGEDFILEVTANDNTVESADVSLKVLSYFTKYWQDIRVEAGENYAVDGEAAYDSKEDELSFKVSKKADASSDSNVIARMITKIPTDVPEGLEVTYRITKGALKFADGSKGSFSGKLTTQCASPLLVNIETTIVGTEGGYIGVTDADGNAVEGANVYTESNVLLGVTGEDGRIFTNAYVDSVKKISVYAEKDGHLSFITTSQSFKPGATEDGLPAFIKLNAVKNPESAQSISWMSSPSASAGKAVVKYAEKTGYEANGEAAFREAEGKSRLVEMPSSAMLETNYAVRVNAVKVTGLKADTEYVYCVGDGEKMSDVKTFSTSRKNAGVNFFVIGDTQATDTTNTDQITKILGESGVDYDFGIQTGDAVDNGGNYTMWANIAKVFSGDFLGNQDLIQVLGNHEYYGDTDASSANAYFDLSDDEAAPDYYSTQYGNVYVAVINYGKVNEDTVKWVKKDAAKSDATWKVLTLHQPPYYTNPSGNSEETAQAVRDLADDAGFDFVFSGHDHSYARTAAQTGGKLNENGTVYYICGSTGEKSYEIVKNDAFNFEMLVDDYNATYITANVTDTTFSLTTYDYNGSEPVIIDTYTKTKDIACSKDGHALVYDDGELYCSVCGYPVELEGYTGFARDLDTGRNMYFLGGEKKIGWLQYDKDAYYFDENGLGLVGEHQIGKVQGTFRFDSDGRQIGAVFEKFDGGVRAFRGSNTSVLVGWHEIEGNLYYFSRSNGAMRTGKATVKVRTGQKLNYVFSDDGKLVRGAFYETADGTVYYWGSDMVSGWQKIEGKTYYFEPSTHLMADDTTEIDGKVYAFAQTGELVHEGAHEWGERVVRVERSCTVDGEIRYTCAVCGSKKIEKEPALGHVDKDGDGICDDCHFSVDFNSPTNNFFYRLLQKFLFIFRLIFQKIGSIVKH